MNISVVIPLYNKEAYIRRALESVLHQETPPDEILVIDDGSTDKSAKEVQMILDARIRLIQQPNAGEAGARNRGMAEAENEIVAFLDADDEWKPGFLTHIDRLFNCFPQCGIYATAFEAIHRRGKTYHPKNAGIPSEPWIGILPNYFRSVQISMPFFPSSVSVNKQFCLQEGGFPTGVKRGGDIMMWVQMGIRFPLAYSNSSQVIYHREALNRACDVFDSLEESACAKMMLAMLENHEVPVGLEQDFKDYYALLQINKARDMIKAGQPQPARSLLTKVRDNRRYGYQRLKWLVISYAPDSLVRTYGRIRNGE
jgi:glycosyltransferase involved in cell wall biosynthesis